MSNTLRLLIALIEIAPDLKRIVGSSWPTFRDELLDLSGRFEHEGESLALDKDLDELIARLLQAASLDGKNVIRRAMTETSAGDKPQTWRSTATATRSGGATTMGAGDPQPSSEAFPDGVVEVPVFYGTDRKLSGAGRPDDFYSGRRGDGVAYGIARVTVPTEGRDVGDLASPAWWKLQLTPDPVKHVILFDIKPLERQPFVVALRDALASADERDALLFVHGYNVTFTDAARRAAQIAVDLKYRGRTLLYSWASAGDPKQYTVDEETIDWSTRRFRAFLQLALTEAGARDVHVIAHSMGNRALMKALEEIEVSAFPAGSATLCQVIFAAPDISCDTFRDLAAAFHGRAQRCTLYASSGDIALKASKLVNGYARAGEAGDSLVIVDGVDTIDASRVDTSLIGLRHSYFGSKRSILRDLAEIITHRTEPSRRFELKEAGAPPRRYWAYRE